MLKITYSVFILTFFGSPLLTAFQHNDFYAISKREVLHKPIQDPELNIFIPGRYNKSQPRLNNQTRSDNQQTSLIVKKSQLSVLHSHVKRDLTLCDAIRKGQLMLDRISESTTKQSNYQGFGNINGLDLQAEMEDLGWSTELDESTIEESAPNLGRTAINALGLSIDDEDNFHISLRNNLNVGNIPVRPTSPNSRVLSLMLSISSLQGHYLLKCLIP
jgi:hypothetical protein